MTDQSVHESNPTEGHTIVPREVAPNSESQEDINGTTLIPDQNTTEVVERVHVDAQEFDIEMFIEEVKMRPCLWKTSTVDYKDRAIKMNAWNNLSSLFNKDVDFLKTQLKYLKDNYKKCLDRQRRSLVSGSSKLPKCRYYNQLSFLHENAANIHTDSSINISSPEYRETAVSNSDRNNTQSSNMCIVDSSQSASTLKRKVVSWPSRSNKKFTSANARNELNLTARPTMVRPICNFDKSDPATEKDLTEEVDGDTLFCKSLVPMLKQLPPRKNRLAKLKIHQLLFDIEFEENQQTSQR